ncbi:MAG: YidC/Oxa1 family membrane protein insertase [Eubacteriales bacterium]|nr:YidC/Oxa1 family membrane protein insertase [Eubacteriales bacterium]MDY3332444.1 YidC/Oxa1 family membrane protein insertase [Gallibacter sp.]
MTALIGFLAKPIGYLLFYIYNIVNNYGIAIIIVTAVVKILLYPLYVKQMKSTASSSEIQKKVNILKSKYGNDKALFNQKVSELYKEEGFSPAGGCLPAIIQMFIVFALFALLRDPMSFVNDDKILFAVHESFLWIPNLSQPDKWILPILAGAATYISFSISQQTMTANPDMGGMMKMMKYFFPLMIVLMGRSFPAGLAIYWFFGQFLQIFFNLHINKIKKNMTANKKRGGKK